MSRNPITRAVPLFTSASGALMSVNASMPVSDALEHASCILDAIDDLAINISEFGFKGSEIFAIQCLAETAKGLVDASIGGLLDAERYAKGCAEQFGSETHE